LALLSLIKTGWPGLFVIRTVVAPEVGLLGSVGLEAKASKKSPQKCGDFSYGHSAARPGLCLQSNTYDA